MFRRSNTWLMSEEEVLRYFSDTYGGEFWVESLTEKEYREGETHTRSREYVLCAKDGAGPFRFFEWAGYTYSPGPIPQIFPSFGREQRDDYQADSLRWELDRFLRQEGLGELDRETNAITLTGADWEEAVRRLGDFTAGLREQNPYPVPDPDGRSMESRLGQYCFQRTAAGGVEASCRAYAAPGDLLGFPVEEILTGLRESEAQNRAVRRFTALLESRLYGADLDFSVRSVYDAWNRCERLEASITAETPQDLEEALDLFAALAADCELTVPQPDRERSALAIVSPSGSELCVWHPFREGGLDAEAIRSAALERAKTLEAFVPAA